VARSKVQPSGLIGAIVDDESVFTMDPQTVAWLAGTCDPHTAQRALLEALALSAEANLARGVAGHTGQGSGSPPLFDLLSDDKVSAIAASASAAFHALPIPSKPGPAQQLARDELIHRGVQRPEADVTWLP
jgi:hypothetical protein